MPLPLSRNRDFVALWTSQTLSALGTSISSLAYPLVVLELTGSPAQAGLVGAVLGLTTFVLRLPAGLAADRWDRRTIMLVADAARLAAVGSVGVAFLADRATLPHILGAAAVEGAFGVLFGPAEMAAVRHVVHPAQIRDAIARVQSRSQLAGLIGPPIGGALLGVKNALPFLADAVSYLVSFLAVASIGSPLQSDVARRPPTRLAAEIGGGAAWLVRQPFLRALVLWLAGASLAFNSIGLVTMVVARERGATAAEIGILFGITSAGGVLGALAAE